MNQQLPREFLRWTGVSLVLWLAATGCESWQFGSREPVPPDYLKVTARATPRAEDDQPFNAYKERLSAPLISVATAIFSRQTSDPAQRLLIAHAEARRSALRSLGQKLAALTDRQGRKLGERLKEAPEKQAALTQILETASSAVYTDKPVASTAQVTIDGLLILHALNSAPPNAAAPDARLLTPGQRESRRRSARKAALAEARAILRDRILNLQLSDGRLLKDILAEDPTAKKDFDGIIFIEQNAPPDDVRYLSDGSCEVTLYFNKNIARDLAEHKSQRRLFRWLRE